MNHAAPGPDGILRCHWCLSTPEYIAYHDEDHVRIGDRVIPCDGPRFHVRNTSEIIDFSLHKTLVEDPKTGHFCLIGFIDDPQEDVSNRNTHYFLARNYQ